MADSGASDSTPERSSAAADQPADEATSDAGSSPAGPPRGGRRRWLRLLGIVLVALLGAVIGASITGRTTIDTAVGTVELSARPNAHGQARISLAPLGRVEIPALRTPVAVTARLVALRDDLVVTAGREIIESQDAALEKRANEAAERAGEQIADGLVALLARIVLGATAGAALTAAVVYRRWRVALAAGAIGLVTSTGFWVVTLVTADLDAAKVTTTGVIGLLPQASPGLTKDASGLQEYAAKTIRNMEGLYNGYVRSASAERIAKRSRRVIAVSGDPTDGEVRRQVAVLATSQGATGVIWIATTDPPAGQQGWTFPEDIDASVMFVSPDGPPAPAGSSWSDATVGSGTATFDRLGVLVIAADGSTTRAPNDRVAVTPTGVAVPSMDLPVVSTGTKPTAVGAGLTASSTPPRITTGVAADGALQAVVLSFDDRKATLLEAQLVTVADGRISMQRVLE